MTCLECNGDGFIAVLNCSYPASACCGGCYVDEKCDICYGYGEIVVFSDDEYGTRLENILNQANKNAEKHEALIKNIERALFDHLVYTKLL